VYGKNDFAEVFKNLIIYTDLKIILLGYLNNYVVISSMMSNIVKSFDIRAVSLNVLHNYFSDLTKLFLDPYLNF